MGYPPRPLEWPDPPERSYTLAKLLQKAEFSAAEGLESICVTGLRDRAEQANNLNPFF